MQPSEQLIEAPTTDGPTTATAPGGAARRLETAAERSVMIALSGSCVTPLGALARLSEDRATLRLAGFLAREDGSAWTTASRDERFDGSATAAEALGGALAEELRRSLRGGV